MADTSNDILIAGAGVLGLATAAELASRGHCVVVVDPDVGNASAVAAGMIAPAMEALLDGADAERAALLRDARDLWPAFAARHGLTLYREPAEWRGPDAADKADRLEALGFAVERGHDVVATSDDWRIDPEDGLRRLGASPGVRPVADRVSRLGRFADGWRVRGDSGRTWTARAVVLATGVGAAPAGTPPATAALIAAIQPIRGQIAFLPQILTDRVVRGAGAYVAPATGGAVIGATMEAGERALEVNREAGARQTATGLALVNATTTHEPEYRIGVRGASPDGLPMAGPSGAPGLHLALAPRRNGWLLAPLTARIVADGIEGRGAGDHAATLNPLRFL